MKKPLVSHLDPSFWDRLPILAEMISAFYGRRDGVSMTLSMSGTSGMEAGLVNLVAPGETVIAASGGFFGNRIQEMVRRRGANLIALNVPFGRHVPNDEILTELEQHPEAVMVGVVHAETSTGVAHPVQELGEAMRALGEFFAGRAPEARELVQRAAHDAKDHAVKRSLEALLGASRQEP
jgi:alanine-glyoxylate transaminase/serine-glyoxylate transaminase/serine-pyruvate transaminase